MLLAEIFNVPLLWPLHNIFEVVPDNVGKGFTVTVTTALLLQPAASVPVTVKVVVVPGVTDVLAQVGQATPVVGSQE